MASRRPGAMALGMQAVRPKPLAGSVHDSPTARSAGTARRKFVECSLRQIAPCREKPTAGEGSAVGVAAGITGNDDGSGGRSRSGGDDGGSQSKPTQPQGQRQQPTPATARREFFSPFFSPS